MDTLNRSANWLRRANCLFYFANQLSINNQMSKIFPKPWEKNCGSIVNEFKFFNTLNSFQLI